MLERSRESDFALKSLDAHRRCQLGPQHLYGDRAAVAEIARQINGCHSARADLALDTVPIGEARLQGVAGVDHVSNLTPADACCQPGLAFRSRARPEPRCQAGRLSHAQVALR